MVEEGIEERRGGHEGDNSGPVLSGTVSIISSRLRVQPTTDHRGLTDSTLKLFCVHSKMASDEGAIERKGRKRKHSHTKELFQLYTEGAIYRYSAQVERIEPTGMSVHWPVTMWWLDRVVEH